LIRARLAPPPFFSSRVSPSPTSLACGGIVSRRAYGWWARAPALKGPGASRTTTRLGGTWSAFALGGEACFLTTLMAALGLCFRQPGLCMRSLTAPVLITHLNRLDEYCSLRPPQIYFFLRFNILTITSLFSVNMPLHLILALVFYGRSYIYIHACIIQNWLKFGNIDLG
jgi:hypothetical protein